jgi:hypothetical protein
MNRSHAWTLIYAAAIGRGEGDRSALNIANAGLDHFIARFRGGESDRQDSTTSAVRSDFPAQLLTMLGAFEGDPADSVYQRGFLAALLQVANYAGISVPNHDELAEQVSRHNPNPHYCVDGHDTPSPCSSLSGDGRHGPFRVFDTEAQDYLPGLYFHREEAQVVADRLND